MRGGSRPIAASLLTVIALGALTGCAMATGKQAGSTTSASRGKPATRCGTARTAVGVPVEVEIQEGSVACQAALAIQRDYARAVASGKVPGNGGGAPVKIRGWVCQGFSTPKVLATGQASACKKDGAEILAVLASPSASPASS